MQNGSPDPLVVLVFSSLVLVCGSILSDGVLGGRLRLTLAIGGVALLGVSLLFL